MYCPRCSQQQGEGVGFCSRCGFQLAVVKELLVTDGALPARAANVKSGGLSAGGKGARLGAKLLFFSLVLLPFFFALSVIFDSPGPLFPPALTFLAGLTLVLYVRVFGEDLLPSSKAARPSLSESMSTTKLPLRSGLNGGELGAQPVNTAEMIQPPSVTERTTTLL